MLSGPGFEVLTSVQIAVDTSIDMHQLSRLDNVCNDNDSNEEENDKYGCGRAGLHLNRTGRCNVWWLSSSLLSGLGDHQPCTNDR